MRCSVPAGAGDKLQGRLTALGDGARARLHRLSADGWRQRFGKGLRLHVFEVLWCPVSLDGSMGEEVAGRGESNCLVWLG